MRVLVQYLGKGISLQEGHLQGRGGGGEGGDGGRETQREEQLSGLTGKTN